MELLMNKKIVGFLVLMIIPLLGNKACEKAASFEHPVVPKETECKECHEDGRDAKTKPAGHDLAWERDHGKFIQRYGFKPQTNCTLCHTESQCTTCHQQEKPKDHNEFWRLKSHGLAVGLDRSQCYTCHRGPDFCQRCHAQTQPLDHSAAWGAPSNRHCLNCHFPLTSAGAERCAVCHTGTPSHSSAPNQPANALHVTGANCRSCHSPLRHPDNGMSCTVCHAR
jgi:hypothetical protein